MSTILILMYIAVFFAAVFMSLKFEFSEESKDERGKSILNMSYRYVFPLFPLGWLGFEMYDRFIDPISYSAYKAGIWILLTGLLIVQASIVTVARKRY